MKQTRPTLELSMIVRNGAKGLARCLDSVGGLVDRIVIGDTGSTDKTREIAARYGAVILDVSWNDDFADARNQALAAAVCDWVLVLDWDEMLDETAAAALPALLDDETIAAYSVSFYNYVQELGHRCGGEQAVPNPGTLEQARASPAYFHTESTRLFRRDPRIRFEHCVHENVLDSLDAAGLRRGRANFIIHHFGYTDDPMGRSRKKDGLYHRLSLKKLAAAPASFSAQLEAGIAEIDHAKNPQAALQYLSTAITLSPEIYVAWHYRAICLSRLGRWVEALHDLQHAAVRNERNPLIHSLLGDVHFQMADYADARKEYEAARSLGDASALSYAKLGATEVKLGLAAKGLAKVTQAVAESPAIAELLDILSTTAWLAGDYQLACHSASRRLSMAGAVDFHFILAATLHLQAQELAKGKLILSIGSRLFPENVEIEQMIAAL